MFAIDENFRNAVIAAITKQHNWNHGKNHVKCNGDEVLVSYFDDANEKWSHRKIPGLNEIFWLDTSTKDFWLCNCGYYTRTTLLRINDCLAAADLPLHVYVSKYSFCIKNTKTGKSWIAGDGKITRVMIAEHLMA